MCAPSFPIIPVDGGAMWGMLPPQHVNTERRVWFIRLPATLFLFGTRPQAV
jgi:hypothetical protein